MKIIRGWSGDIKFNLDCLLCQFFFINFDLIHKNQTESGVGRKGEHTQEMTFAKKKEFFDI